MRKKDFFYYKAKDDNYLARSVYKLQEIQARLKILRPGMKILDLGCAPGSWAQYTSEVIGPQGRIVGVDLSAVKMGLPNATFIEADLRDLELAKKLEDIGIPPPFDVVLSDMAPKTTGIRVTDQARSHTLCEMAIECADRFLKPGGTLVFKLFHSESFEDLRKDMRLRYNVVEVIKPKSTRTESKEIFFIGLQKKATPLTV